MMSGSHEAYLCRKLVVGSWELDTRHLERAASGREGIVNGDSPPRDMPDTEANMLRRRNEVSCKLCEPLRLLFTGWGMFVSAELAQMRESETTKPQRTC